MSHVFKIGDRARLNCASHKEHNGKEVVIKSTLYVFKGFNVHEVDIVGFNDPTPHVPFRAMYETLIPLQPPKSQISEILAMKNCPDRDCKIARVGEWCNG